MLNKCELVIKRYLKKLGREVTIVKRNGSEDKLLAVVQSFWRSGKSRYQKQETPIGFVADDYYCYTGPSDYDITKLAPNDVVIFDGKKFNFVNAEAIKVKNIVQFYTGTLKRIWEENDAFSL